MTRCGHLQLDNDHINIDDDTRDSRVVTQRYTEPTHVLARCFLSFVFLGVARRLELSPCNTCLHPCTISQAHTALSNVRVFVHDVNLSLDNICLFVHDVKPPGWFAGRACGCRGGQC